MLTCITGEQQVFAKVTLFGISIISREALPQLFKTHDLHVYIQWLTQLKNNPSRSLQPCSSLIGRRNGSSVGVPRRSCPSTPDFLPRFNKLYYVVGSSPTVSPLAEFVVSKPLRGNPHHDKLFIYRYMRRRDDVMALSNGEEVAAAFVDAVINTNPLVRHAFFVK